MLYALAMAHSRRRFLCHEGIYLDPTVAPRADGNIEAPIIGFRESVKKLA